jgi:pimeloyl-ACP methyl ester carboxylesterase
MSPSLIFVHGAGHTPETWDKLTALLDFKSICPALPTASGIGTFKDDIDTVRAAIEGELYSGHDVVVIVHSYGSLPGSSAMKGLTTGSPRVIGFIAMACGFAQTGVGFLEGLGGQPPASWKIEGGLAELTGDARELFYHDLPEEEGDEWVAKITKQAVAAFYGGEHAYAGWKEVPAWYLATTEDKALPIEVQRGLLEKARSEGTVVLREIDSSHSPMLSRPEEVARFIEEAVQSFEAIDQ